MKSEKIDDMNIFWGTEEPRSNSCLESQVRQVVSVCLFSSMQSPGTVSNIGKRRAANEEKRLEDTRSII
jgi:hypothetical protein